MKITYRLFVVIFSFVFMPSFINAQAQSEVDSLLAELAKAEDDTNKVRLYFKLYSLVAYSDYERSKGFIHKALPLAEQLNDRRGIVLCYDKLGGAEMVQSNFRKALHYYQIADSLLQDMNWPREQAIIYGNYAGIYKDIGLYDSAIHWNTKFIEIAEELDNDKFKGYGLGVTGDLYQIKGQFNLAAKYHLQSLQLFEAIGDESRMGDALLKLGEAHLYGERYDDAEIHLKKAAELYKKVNDQYYLRQCYDNLAYTFLRQEQYDKAESWYKKAEAISRELEDTYGLAGAFEGYELIAFAKGQYELAQLHNQSAIELYTQNEDRYNLSWRQVNRANILHKAGKINEAIQQNTIAENQFKELDAPSGLRKVYENYYLFHKDLGQTNKALVALEKYNEINDSLFNVETKTEIEELQLTYEVEKKDQEIQLLAKDKALLTASAQVDQLKRQRLTWGLILLGLLASLIIYSQYITRKRNQKIQEERLKRKALELEKQTLEKQQLERELAAQILQFCRKNELLQSVKQEVAAIAHHDVSGNKSKLQKLERSIEFDMKSDQDWTQFLSTFEKVHPDFIVRLREKVERLTPAEHRLACLFKINLSSKEIATLLNISDEGVKKARYRLRKKLNLNKEINLQEWVMQL